MAGRVLKVLEEQGLLTARGKTMVVFGVRPKLKGKAASSVTLKCGMAEVVIDDSGVSIHGLNVTIEATGNEEATRYYQEMKSEAELATFLAWLDTLKTSLSGSTTFVTDMTKPPFHMIDLDAPTDAKGIPQPKSSGLQGSR